MHFAVPVFPAAGRRVTVLRDAAVGTPVFLTKNGHGRYAILDMQDFEKTQATIRLMNELAKGRSENLSLTRLLNLIL